MKTFLHLWNFLTPWSKDLYLKKDTFSWTYTDREKNSESSSVEFNIEWMQKNYRNGEEHGQMWQRLKLTSQINGKTHAIG